MIRVIHELSKEPLIPRPKVIPRFEACGPDGNIYRILSCAGKFLVDRQRGEEFSLLLNRVLDATEYSEALIVIEDYTEIYAKDLIDLYREK